MSTVWLTRLLLDEQRNRDRCSAAAEELRRRTPVEESKSDEPATLTPPAQAIPWCG
jgi:hypothetical protein